MPWSSSCCKHQQKVGFPSLLDTSEFLGRVSCIKYFLSAIGGASDPDKCKVQSVLLDGIPPVKKFPTFNSFLGAGGKNTSKTTSVSFRKHRCKHSLRKYGFLLLISYKAELPSHNLA